MTTNDNRRVGAVDRKLREIVVEAMKQSLAALDDLKDHELRDLDRQLKEKLAEVGTGLPELDFMCGAVDVEIRHRQQGKPSDA